MRVAILLLLAGCDYIFTLEEPRTVEITYDRQWLDLDGVHLEAVTPETLEVHEIDGTPIDVDIDGVGRASFSTRNTTYLVTAGTPGFSRLVVQHTGPRLHLRERIIGRLDRTTPGPTTAITLNVSTAPVLPVNSHFVLSTGLPIRTNLTSFMQTLPYNNEALSVSGPLGLLESNLGDHLYLLAYRNTAGTADLNLVGYFDTPITTANNFPTQVVGTINTADNSHCTMLSAQRLAEADRIRRIAPAQFGIEQANWQIDFVPNEVMGPTGGAALASNFQITDLPSTKIMYTQPMLGTTLASMGVARSRLYPPGSNPDTGTPLAFVVRVYDVVDTTQMCPTVDLAAGRIALVGSIAIDGALIDSDNVGIARQTIDVTWTIGPGPIDFFQVILAEIVTNAGVTKAMPRLTIQTVDRRVKIRRDQLESGKSYFIAVIGNLGTPLAKDGDYSELVYPVGVSSANSGVFTVE